MELQRYIDYIVESRKRGFRDEVIKQSLIEKGWPESEIKKAFYKVDGEESFTREVEEETKIKSGKKTKKSAKESVKSKGVQEKVEYTKTGMVDTSAVMIFLDNELRDALKKRAKKNMFTLTEQVEDILRRSVLRQKLKKTPYDGKIDDKLVSVFSRKKTGPKTKAKKKPVKKKAVKKKVKSKK